MIVWCIRFYSVYQKPKKNFSNFFIRSKVGLDFIFLKVSLYLILIKFSYYVIRFINFKCGVRSSQKNVHFIKWIK